MFSFILSLISFTITAGILFTAVILRRSREVAPGMIRAYSALAFCVGVWCLGYTFMFHATNTDDVTFWYRFSAIGWTMLPCVVLYLVWQMHLYLTGRKDRPGIVLAFFALYPYLCAEGLRGRLLATGFEMTPFGPVEIISGMTLPGIVFTVSIIGALGSCFVLMLVRFKHATLRKHRSQIIMIIIPAAIVGTACITENIFMARFDLPRFPSLGHIIMGAWSLHMGYVIMHYPVLNMRPQFAMQSILLNMHDMVILTGRMQNIVMANSAAERLLGYEEGGLSGLDASALFEDGDHLFAHAAAAGKSSFFETDFTCRDGSVIPCHCRLELLRDSFRDPIGFVLFARDIRDIKTMESLAKELTAQQEELQANYQQIEKKNRMMQAELELARRIQHRLVPQTPPKISGAAFSMIYQPMAQIGGDLYDFVSFHDHNKVGLFICDVSGHGVPAALVSGIVKTLITTAGDAREYPDSMLLHLNERIAGQIGKNFITAFYGIYDAETRVLRYARAGHPYPCVVRNGSVLRLESRGIMLGFRPDIRPEVRSVQLEHGDKLLLFTDGLLEASDSKRAFFEESAFDRALIAHSGKHADEFTSALFREMIEHKCSRELEDDVCVVCMELV